jgi:hypothetical protein
MKHSKLWPRQTGLFVLALLLTLVPAIFLTSLHADDSNTMQANQTAGQRTFATPDDAINALRSATESGDRAALAEIFGPDFPSLGTGDPVQDQHNARRFAREMEEGCQQASNEDQSITLEVGTNQWPMPIPLVKINGQWQFDTAAGKEEIINRHIGKDELHAIGVCRAYVLAQKQHAAADSKGCYAISFVSTEGTHDGLYWPASLNGGSSPFGPRVAEAQTGYHVNVENGRPQPFHGYYFKILTCQGPDAPGGKMDYVHHGKMTDGFALVAYPENWDESGIMTFIVGPEGKVYQKNLGAETRRLVRKMKAYSPDETWTIVLDDGVATAAAE